MRKQTTNMLPMFFVRACIGFKLSRHNPPVRVNAGMPPVAGAVAPACSAVRVGPGARRARSRAFGRCELQLLLALVAPRFSRAAAHRALARQASSF